MKKIVASTLALVMGLGLMACGSVEVTTAAATTTKAAETTTTAAGAAETTTTAAANALSGKLVASGSTSVQPIFELLGEAFMVKNPDVTVEVQAGGSSTGFSNVAGKVTEVGNLSRELKDTEAATPDLQQHILCLDGIAVVVNPASAVKDLTLEQVAKIFMGEITNWNEVGGADQAIQVVSREAGSGTRGAFEEILDIEDKVVAQQEVNETGIVKNTVAGNPNAIGYISLGSLDETVHAVSVDGVAPAEATVVDKSYKITRPFIACNLGTPSPVFQAFLDFTFSEEGASIIRDHGFVPVK